MPAVVRYDQLLPRLQAEMPGCPTPLLLLKLRDAGRALCERGEVWVEELDAIDLVAEQLEYTLAIAWDASVIRITELRINTDEGVSEGLDGTVQPEEYYEFTPPTTITLDTIITPQAAVTDGLELVAVLVPDLDCNELPDWFFNRFAEGLIGRVQGQLCVQERKPWSNRFLAATGKLAWDRTLSSAIGDKMRLYKNGQGLEPQ